MSRRLPTLCSAILGVIILVGCNHEKDEGKIPVTTSSAEALRLYRAALELQDNLRFQESLEPLRQAVALDSSFALAHLSLSQAEPTVTGFFRSFGRARALADGVSPGERLWILGFEAGVNADPMTQRKYYTELAAQFPNDERAHNLLGNNYFGQQEYGSAIVSFERAITINRRFAQPYNQLGYAHRFLGNYLEAEKAFKTYIELIPNDPNPYDSYAELLLKMGRYDESIVSYQRALALNPNFVASHLGIATNLNLKGQHDEAREHVRTLQRMARNDGERRAATFAMAVSHAYQGQLDSALVALGDQYAIAAGTGDVPAMAADLNLAGTVLLELGRIDDAQARFDTSVALMRGSGLAQEVIDNAVRANRYNTAKVALARGDAASARAQWKAFHREVEALNNPNQLRLSSELAGLIALSGRQYDTALREFGHASQLDPYNLYRTALAYKGKGDSKSARAWFRRVVEFNPINNLNHALVRQRAVEALASR
ncbi:MAG: tetratricopeptide repeat protein [Candidatus Eisenbacteria bacterium]|jgi:tetratricopeptide (TPR) repeat protein|nr:tetratricopeptide repeat protein [Candidatus Eisenbacteria bacterium]